MKTKLKNLMMQKVLWQHQHKVGKNKSDASPQNGLILNRMMKLYLIESVTITEFRAHHGIDCAIYMRSASYVTRNYVNIIIIFSTVTVIATCTFQSCLLRGNYRYTCNTANRTTRIIIWNKKKLASNYVCVNDKAYIQYHLTRNLDKSKYLIR